VRNQKKGKRKERMSCAIPARGQQGRKRKRGVCGEKKKKSSGAFQFRKKEPRNSVRGNVMRKPRRKKKKTGKGNKRGEKVLNKEGDPIVAPVTNKPDKGNNDPGRSERKADWWQRPDRGVMTYDDGQRDP